MENQNMTKCKSCGQEISKKAVVCPGCGVKVKKPLYKKWWFWVIMGVLSLAVVGAVGGNQDTAPADQGAAAPAAQTAQGAIDADPVIETTTAVEETTPKMTAEEFKNSCQDFNYKQIARNPENYIGQNFKVAVRIISSAKGGLFSGYDKYYKARTKSENRDIYLGEMIYLIDEQDSKDGNYLKILDDDIIIAYGTFEGMTGSQNAITKEKSEEVAIHLYYAELIEE
ncbi:MAG: zinc ribbon domain-containing protein [Clostridia bacterium]|nr:zinc ribbon domain-containing protein [Clostridia bacterium]